MEDTGAWIKDAAERVVWTFIEGALGVPLGAEILEVITNQEIAVSAGLAMLAGGVGAVIALVKSLAAERLSTGGTAQWGTKTYSYSEAGPGSAGGDMG